MKCYQWILKLILCYTGVQIFISVAAGATTVAITSTMFYVLVVALWMQDNSKLFQESKSRLKRTLTWNKYQWKVSTQAQNRYLDFLIDPSLLV